MSQTNRCALCLAAVLLSLLMCPALTYGQEVIERARLWSATSQIISLPHPWNLTMTRAEGGTRANGSCLWFNTDWKAKPWAGVRFEGGSFTPFELTNDWIDKGFIRFYINVTIDRYGNIGGGDQYQLKPITEPPVPRYQAVRSQFIDQGRGLDEEASTWQEVLVPLKYFTSLKPGHVIKGLYFQTRHQIERTFSLDDVAYVRFDILPTWMRDQLNEDVIQEWATWPSYEDLPAVAKADRRPISVRDGKFVYPDGTRAFLINPYCREDSRAVYGIRDSGELPPTYDLYNRDKHGWIYDEVPTTEHLCRLGFNSLSATPVPTRWWRSVGYRRPRGSADDAFLSVLSDRVTLPYYVDLVSWPYTMGAPGLHIEDTDLPETAATQGRNHWTQYRIIGAGRQAWMDMWTLNARRYREAGAKAIVVELMNEPAYMGESKDHYRQFEQWLRTRYESIEAVNRIWGTDLESLAEAAVYRFSHEDPPPAGQRLDYDEYLSEQLTEMIAEGVEAVGKILPEALVGLQPMGGYMQTPREAVWKHRIARHETVVLTPTGGGRWTRGAGASQSSETVADHPIADAPIENDLLLAVADNKMIVDNETYLRGQTRADTRNRLWEHVVCGLDGLTVFSWSKRGWVWWQDREAVQVDADKYPYSCLIPIARRTDALRGILDFSVEVQSLAGKILPKPWGPEPKIGLLYSWDNARRRIVEPELYDKLPVYYAAMRYSHWNMAMLPSDRMIAEGVPDHIEVVVAGGLTHVERELPAALRAFVQRGGILILGECDFTKDIHGHDLLAENHLVPATFTNSLESPSTVQVGQSTRSRFPGEVSFRRLQEISVPDGATTVLRDAAGRPIVTRRRLDQGAVYYQAADASGYGLAALLHEILVHAGGGTLSPGWRLVEVCGAGGHLAPNVLVSRRSYGDHHAVLLHNRDRYDRTVYVAVPGLTGSWRVTDVLWEASSPRVLTDAELSHRGVKVDLSASGPAVLLVERPEE